MRTHSFYISIAACGLCGVGVALTDYLGMNGANAFFWGGFVTLLAVSAAGVDPMADESLGE